jgi:hypothetical protein
MDMAQNIGTMVPAKSRLRASALLKRAQQMRDFTR